MFIPTSNAVVAGRYELVAEIGRGGMGVIWRARQADGLECAIKFIHAAVANDPEVRSRFVREARAAASLRGPNSVTVLDVDEWEGCRIGLYRKLRVRVQTLDGAVVAWVYVLDGYEGGLPTARYLGQLAEAAETAGAPDDYVLALRHRPCRSVD